MFRHFFDHDGGHRRGWRGHGARRLPGMQDFVDDERDAYGNGVRGWEAHGRDRDGRGFDGRDPDGRGHHREGHRGGRGPGGERTRVLGRGELPLVVLSLLEAAPRHGYELIRCIEERCLGAYSPSAGVIYPTLTMLEEQGFASVGATDDSGKRRYTITEAGRAYVADNEGLIKGAFARLDMVARMRARDALPARVAQAMETLKQALLAPSANWHAHEAERVATIIERAALTIVDGHDRQAEGETA